MSHLVSSRPLLLTTGFTQLSRYLIDKYPAAAMAVSKSGRLPVQTAARCNEDPALSLYLLTRSPTSPRAILSHQDNAGQNLLQDAVAAKNVDLVRILMQDYGADANVPDKLGRTAIHHAAMIGSIDILIVLRELETENKVARIEWDAPDTWDQWTPLMHAAREGHIDCARYLMGQCGASCSQIDKRGRTPRDIGRSGRDFIPSMPDLGSSCFEKILTLFSFLMHYF